MLLCNGVRWARAIAPSIGNHSSSRAVSCVSTRSCWAVGSLARSEGGSVNEVLHWNGTRWKHVRVPRAGALAAVSCPSMRACWAVGMTGNPKAATARNEALRWNGRRWSAAQVPGLLRSSKDSSGLTGVSCTSSTYCWAVGDIGDGIGKSRNEALHWNGRRRSVD